MSTPLDNYQIIAPTLVTDFSSTTGMTLTQGTGSVSLVTDPAYVRTGTGSIKITQAASATSAALDLDCRNAAFGGSGADGFTAAASNLWHLRCFVDTPANQNSLSFFVSNTAAGFTDYFNGTKMGPQIGGTATNLWWDRPENRKDWAVAAGSPSWSTTVKTIRIRPNANANGALTVYCDALYRGGYARPKILITFDDSNNQQWDRAKPILDEYGIKATFYCIGEPISTDNAGSITTAQAHTLYDAGHDLAFHGWLSATANWGAITEAEFRSEIENFIQFFEGEGFSRSMYHLAWPQGVFNATLTNIVQSYGFITGRTVMRLIQSHLLGLDSPLALRGYSWSSTDGTAGPISWMNEAVNYGSTIFIAFHQHHATVSTGNQISDADFETIIRHAYKLQQSNLADVVTHSQWYNGLTASTSRRLR